MWRTHNNQSVWDRDVWCRRRSGGGSGRQGDGLVPSTATHVRSGGAGTCSGTKGFLLSAATEVEAKVPWLVAKALAKQRTDGRTMDGGTGVPTGPNYVGGCKERFNNQSEEEVVDAGQGDEVGGEEDDGAALRCGRGDHGSGQKGKKKPKR